MRKITLSMFVLAGLLCSASVSAQVCAPVPEGIVSWWPGEGDASDIVGGNSGTLIGGVTFPSAQVLQAFSLGGIGGGVLIGNPSNLQLQSFTIETWIRRASATRVSDHPFSSVVVGYGSGGYGLGLLHDGTVFLTRIDVDQVTSGQLRVTDIALHHVAVTKSDDTVVFYVDGVATTPQTYTTVFTFSTNAGIGTRADNFTGVFLGLIDELSIYDRALTDEEIQTIFTAGAAGKCLP